MLESMTTQKDVMIAQATEAGFVNHWGTRLAGAFSSIIRNEVALAQKRPNLFHLPNGSELEVPFGLQDEVASGINEAWDELRTKYTKSGRSFIMTAESLDLGRAYVKFDVDNLEALRQGQVEAHCIQIDDIHLPLRIGIFAPEAAVVLRKPGISTDLMMDICLGYAQATGEIGDDPDEEALFLAGCERTTSLLSQEELLPLGMFLRQTERFCRVLEEGMMIIPERLMTAGEMGQWNSMVSQVQERSRIGERVVVGRPGYGSYREMKARFSFSGLGLETVNLDSKGENLGIVDLALPVPVKRQGETVGWSVFKRTEFASLGQVYNRLHHGNHDLYDFRAWQSKNAALG